MTTIFFKFEAPVDVSPLYLDGVKIRFNFSYIDSEYIGTPRQSSETKQCKIIAQASRSLLDIWSLEGESIERVLFQVAKEHISSVLSNSASNENILPNEIQHAVNIDTLPRACPFDPDLIEKPSGASFQIEVKRRMGFV